MALLRLAAQAAACRLTVLTVDHGLRPGSAAEARQVGQWCRGLGLAHQTLNWTGASPGSGIQARARKARYDLMADWCNANAASALLTAHTPRRSGRNRADAPAAHRQLRQSRRHSAIRPVARAAAASARCCPAGEPICATYLTALGQDWIEDPSNDDTRFERVRLRRLMPALEETGLTVERLAALAQSCRDVGDAIGAAAGRWCRAHLEQEPGLCRFPAAGFGCLPLALRVRILGTVIAHFGGGGTPERAELERLAEAMAAGTLSRRTLGGALAWRRQASILIGREPGTHRSATRRRTGGGPARLGPALSGHRAAWLGGASRRRVRCAAALTRRAGGGVRCPAGGETAGRKHGSGPGAAGWGSDCPLRRLSCRLRRGNAVVMLGNRPAPTYVMPQLRDRRPPGHEACGES